MATAKKTAAAPVQDSPPMFDAQPHQVVVVAAQPPDPNILRVFIAEPWRRVAFTDQPSIAIVPGIPTVVDAQVLAGRDGAKLLKDGILRIADESRGVLPVKFDAQDTALRAELRDGQRPGPNHQQMLDHFRQKYLEYSLGEAVLLLMEKAGWSEEDAAATLVPEYESAFERRDGSVRRRSWLVLAERIIANGHAGEEE